ncbi:hypothetical protein [Streptomyces venezuelae]|uniref:hypothetical protein n=1 Tax=Streptomyces venezuelae TaxID=54571 RepID=UPI003646F7DD
MDLRPDLLPPPVSPARLHALCREIGRIAELVGDRGREAEAEAAVAAFNEATGHRYGPLDFAEYDAARGLEEFAREAARPAWPRVPDVTRAELVEIIRRAMADPASPDCDYYLLLLDTNVVHPHADDLLFHPPAGLVDGVASAEDLVDAMLSYRPISL